MVVLGARGDNTTTTTWKEHQYKQRAANSARQGSREAFAPATGYNLCPKCDMPFISGWRRDIIFSATSMQPREGADGRILVVAANTRRLNKTCNRAMTRTKRSEGRIE